MRKLKLYFELGKYNAKLTKLKINFEKSLHHYAKLFRFLKDKFPGIF